MTVTATGEATRGVYATRAKNVGGGMTACSSPRATWAVRRRRRQPGSLLPGSSGSTRARARPSSTWQVLGPDGAVEGPGLRGITIPSGSNRSLRLSEVAPSQGNLSIDVQASRGLVEAVLDDHVLDVVDPAAKPVAEWVPTRSGRPGTSSSAVCPSPCSLKSGSGPNGAGLSTAQDTLVLANPGNRGAVAKIRLSTRDGAFTPKGLQPATVPPASVVAIPLGEFVTNPNTAVLVDADQPIGAGDVSPGAPTWCTPYPPSRGPDPPPRRCPPAVASARSC